jgi:hypothetical protein
MEDLNATEISTATPKRSTSEGRVANATPFFIFEEGKAVLTPSSMNPANTSSNLAGATRKEDSKKVLGSCGTSATKSQEDASPKKKTKSPKSLAKRRARRVRKQFNEMDHDKDGWITEQDILVWNQCSCISAIELRLLVQTLITKHIHLLA